MLWTIIRKEILHNLLSLRFVVAYCLVTALLAGSASIMIGQYLTSKKTHEMSSAMFAAREADAQEWWARWQSRYVSRPPLVTRFLAVGVERDPDGQAYVENGVSPDFYGALRRNPLGNLFPSMDMVFVVGVVFSLIVFMLSYDSVAGEGEQGTLKVLLASAVPRDTVLLGKWIGGFASLSLPYVTACVLISVGLLMQRTVTISLEQWLRILSVFCVCLLFVAVVFSLAMAVSVVSKRSATAAVVLLLVWIGWFVALPLLSTPVAQLLVRPSAVYEAEIAMWRLGSLDWRERDQRISALALAELGYADWSMVPREQRERRWEVLGKFSRQLRRQMNDTLLTVRGNQLRNEIAVGHTARWIARLSPYGCLQNACLELAGTSLQREVDLREAMERYYNAAMDVGVPAEGGVPPAYVVRGTRLSSSAARAAVDLAILGAMGVLLFMVGYAVFLRQELL